MSDLRKTLEKVKAQLDDIVHHIDHNKRKRKPRTVYLDDEATEQLNYLYRTSDRQTYSAIIEKAISLMYEEYKFDE